MRLSRRETMLAALAGALAAGRGAHAETTELSYAAGSISTAPTWRP